MRARYSHKHRHRCPEGFHLKLRFQGSEQKPPELLFKLGEGYHRSLAGKSGQWAGSPLVVRSPDHSEVSFEGVVLKLQYTKDAFRASTVTDKG
jgi:hypothetical protein